MAGYVANMIVVQITAIESRRCYMIHSTLYTNLHHGHDLIGRTLDEGNLLQSGMQNLTEKKFEGNKHKIRFEMLSQNPLLLTCASAWEWN